MAKCCRVFVYLCCLFVLTANILSAETDNRPIVVFRIDDCQRSWLTPFAGLGGVSALDYGKTKKIPITWAVISNLATLGTSMSWAEIKGYLDVAGGEAASHSVTHAALPTTQNYIDEIIESKAAIEANLPGYKCNTFLQPGPWKGDAYMDDWAKLDNPIGQTIQANYSQSQAYLGRMWPIGKPHYKYGTCVRYALDYPENLNLDLIFDAIVATPGLTTVFTGHGVQKQGGTSAYCIPAGVLKTFMDKLADLRDEGEIRLMSLNEVYQTEFSNDLNRIVNADLEYGNAAENIGWDILRGARMVDTGGVDNSRYCELSSTDSQNATLRSVSLSLQPGRYEISWYQKSLPDKLNSGLGVCLAGLQNYASGCNYINWTTPACQAPVNEWQKKTALALVLDNYIMTELSFQAGKNAGYGVDKIEIRKRDIDPEVSPSGSVATPRPTECTVSWKTPNDPAITSIVVRYSFQTHPLTPTTGTLLGTIAAQPGEEQQISGPINWTNRAYIYFSVFGVKSGSAYAPPDLASLKVDTVPPAAPCVTATAGANGTVDVNWTCSTPQTKILYYEYALGTTPGGCDMKNWTSTIGRQACINGVVAGMTVYVSVIARNVFGVYSACGSSKFSTAPAVAPISQILTQPDNQMVTVKGVVTAVFSDCCYVQAIDQPRGIKLVGNISGYKMGNSVTVTGMVRTTKGERFVTVQ